MFINELKCSAHWCYDNRDCTDLYHPVCEARASGDGMCVQGMISVYFVYLLFVFYLKQ